jgi:hypothetical protein
MKRAKQGIRARIKQLAAADAARKAKRSKAQPIVKIEGDASPAFKAAMLQKIADHVLAVHDEQDRPKRGSYKRR